jgi:FkbM family methyltransferase
MILRTLLSKLSNKFIKLIPNEYNEEMFYRIGRMLGVRSFTCNKQLGLFEGSIDDNTVHRYYFRQGTWAPGLQYILRKLFADSPGTYIDIGANIGLLVIPIALTNKFIDLYAFEPEYNNYTFLRKNIIANNLEFKIKAFNIALFSDDCSLDLELSENNMGDHRLRLQSISDSQSINSHAKSPATVKINARKLDSVLNVGDLIKPLVLKVDTQGAEVRVLSGGTNLLKEVDYLIIEYWPYGLQRMGDTTEAFFNIIKQFPFGATYDDETLSIPKLSPITELIAHIDSRLNKDSIDHLDILLSIHPELNK